MKKININTADREELMKLDKIGGAKADNILDYRERTDKFDSSEQLLQVKGIGPGIFNSIKGQITVGKEVTIRFNPADYMLGDVGEVHLVGEMNNWNPADKSYSLAKNQDGIWEGGFAFEKGTEYKIMYDSESWEAGKHIGKGEENLVIE